MPLRECLDDQVLCQAEDKCIPSSFVCDGYPDCIDSTDESRSTCVVRKLTIPDIHIIFNLCVLFRIIVTEGFERTTAECSFGDIRLVGGPDQYSGKVELCVDNVYTSICDSNIAVSEAEVVCREIFGNNKSMFPKSIYFSFLVVVSDCCC